jgi:hypothetical protein
MLLQQWRDSHMGVLTDAALQQLACEMVEMIGNRMLDLVRLCTEWQHCSSAADILAVCATSQRNAARIAVRNLVGILQKQSDNAAKIENFMIQLLQNSAGVGEVDLSDKFGLNADKVYDANAAFKPHVLRIDPDTRVITLDVKFVAEAVKQLLTEIEAIHLDDVKAAGLAEVEAARRWWKYW